MNSESYKHVGGVLKERFEAEQDKTAMKNSEIVEKGKAAVGFESNPFWTIFKDDMLKVREGLMDKLTDASTLTKAQMDTMRLEIRLVKLFANHPKLYMDSLKALSMRRK